MAYVLLYLFVFLPVYSVLAGFALSTAWGWLIVPTFGVDPLSIPSAIGVHLVASYLTYHGDTEKDTRSPEEILLASTMVATIKPLALLAIGYVVSLWI